MGNNLFTNTLSTKIINPGDTCSVKIDHIILNSDDFANKLQTLLFDDYQNKQQILNFAPDVSAIYNEKILQAIKDRIEITIFYNESTIYCIIIGNQAYPSSNVTLTDFGWSLSNDRTRLMHRS